MATKSTTSTSYTINTTVPGPAEPKTHPNYVLIASIALIALVVLAAGATMLRKKLRAKKKTAAKTGEAAPEAPVGETLATMEMKVKDEDKSDQTQ